MQMCPKNQYVYGIKVKSSELDGLTGLMLICRPNDGLTASPTPTPLQNPKSPGHSILQKNANEVIVKDGRGSWSETISNSKQFAYSYELKVVNQTSINKYLTGIKLLMRSIPEIKSVSIEYDLPPHTDFVMHVFNKDSYENKDFYKTEKRSFNSNKQRANLFYDNIYINTQKKYHDEKLYKYMFDKSSKFIEIKVPTIKTKADIPNLDTDRTVHEKLHRFSLE